MSKLLHSPALRPARSIRTTMLGWYCAIVVAVVGGYGAAVYDSARRAAQKEFDAQLEAAARGLAVAWGAMPRPDCPPALPDELARLFVKPKKPKKPPAPPTRQAEESLGRAAASAPPDRESSGDRLYYVLWDAAGKLVASSLADAADIPRPKLNPPAHDPAKPAWRDRDGQREVAVSGSNGTLVLVGRGTEEIRERLASLAGRLFGLGTVVLAASLAGGWFLAGRTLAPIAEITRAAESISASNLSRRVNLAATRTELGRLAAVINGAFDRLAEALRRQADFTADASHELRTPLAVLVARAELCLRRPRDAEHYRETIEAMLQTARQMERTVASLLALARCDAPACRPAHEIVDLGALIDEVIRALAPLAETRGVVLRPDARPAAVRGDREELRRLVVNLVHNAIEYNRPDGRVEITVRIDGDWVELSVADTGQGIPPSHLPYVFERFYRVDTARARDRGGAGLGLAIARAVALEHGGTITASSVPGEGSVFTVRLPQAAAPTAPNPPTNTAAANTTDEGRDSTAPPGAHTPPPVPPDVAPAPPDAAP